MFRRILLLLFLLLVIAPITFLVLAMETEPAVSDRRPSTGSDAARAKAIFREFRDLTEATEHRTIRISASDMNSVLAFAGRGLPFLRGQVAVRPDAVRIEMSADATRIPGGGWLNLRVVIQPSEKDLQLASVQLGTFSLPASLVLPAIGLALDIVLGDGLGQTAIAGIDGVAVVEEEVVLGVGLNYEDRRALARSAKDTVRAAAGVASPEDVRVYYLALDAAVKDGRLPPGGSVAPFIRFAMGEAHKRSSQEEPRSEIKSALLALAIYCGHVKFQEVIGDVVPEQMRRRRTGCASTTLGKRGDLRQHFVVSAGLEAAGGSTVAFAIGEFKELIDSNRGGSGFSFDDLAADRAGIRFANALLSAEAPQRERLLELMATESAILPPLNGLPAGLSEIEFKRRFGDVDNDAYKSTLAEIDRRIDSLSMYSLP